METVFELSVKVVKDDKSVSRKNDLLVRLGGRASTRARLILSFLLAIKRLFGQKIISTWV